MSNQITVDVPLFVLLPRKTKEAKKYIINLNYYLHWKHFVVNDIKIQYTKNLQSKLAGLNFCGKVKLHFRLYQGTKRRVDRANVLSIHEKFFCDALTKYGCIRDDNDEMIEETRYTSGPVDKLNPRVEVIIEGPAVYTNNA